jgi:hypothetical protein
MISFLSIANNKRLQKYISRHASGILSIVNCFLRQDMVNTLFSSFKQNLIVVPILIPNKLYIFSGEQFYH